MQLDSKLRTQIFLAFSAIVIISLIIAGIQASRQNESFLNDYRQSVQAQELLEQAKFAEAVPIYVSLLKSHDYYSVFYWQYGTCLAGQQKWDEAFAQYDKARKIRPALMTEQTFLVQYGELLYRTGHYKSSKQYLQQCLTYGADSKAGKVAKILLPMVEKQLSLQKGGQALDQ